MPPRDPAVREVDAILKRERAVAAADAAASLASERAVHADNLLACARDALLAFAARTNDAQAADLLRAAADGLHRPDPDPEDSP